MSRPASREKPFHVLNARSLAPCVLICEHATNRLPFRRPTTGPVSAILRTHWGWDIGAWDVTRFLAREMSTSAIGGRWSRLLVDLNRRIGDPTLVRRKAGRVVLPWNADITPEEIERRVATYHTPYHVEIDRLILRRVVRGVHPLLLAVHSFTPRLGTRARPFEIGVLYEHHRDHAHRLGRRLRREGLSVRYNEPYSGMKGMMYSVDRHGSHHRLPCLEIEINQRLFAKPGAAARLAAALACGARALCEGNG